MSIYFDHWDPETMTDDQREKYEVLPTGDEGFHSMRAKFSVRCKKCGEVVHENTTGPDCMMEMHDKDGCEG
jgi:formylmethanofuran dehydrogenase subunit E